MTINDRIAALRSEMAKRGLSAYIIPSNDPHQSEYVADHFKAREWISGFDGSAGTVVVTENHAGLWTDSRYFLQAEKQLKVSEFTLHKLVNGRSPGFSEWISNNLVEGETVGIDGTLFSISQFKKLKTAFKSNGIILEFRHDLISSSWEDRPGLPKHAILNHPVEIAGKDRWEKINEIGTILDSKRADYHLVTTLDDIAWILNIRGRDIEFNPVVMAYLLVEPSGICLFIDRDKLNRNLAKTLETGGVRLYPYDQIFDYLKDLPEDSAILIDPDYCNIALRNTLSSKGIIYGETISRLLKARKNKVEIDHIRGVMVKDGVALTRLFMWIEQEVEKGLLTEDKIAVRLSKFRTEQKDYYGESFAAIVGFGANGAIVHYRPVSGNSAPIKSPGMLLIDSGGQYLDGTTDITRTISIGAPPKDGIHRYTNVLKGHIALANAVFPESTTGVQLDILARQYLWKEGDNYLHGTGHGVGFFLNVHEAPQGFTAGNSSKSSAVIEQGMLTSNEPGFYKEGEYGIRIENLILTVKSKYPGFLEHETLTLFPIETKLIDRQMMTNEEVRWLNKYHQKVYKGLSSALTDKEKTWLKNKCAPI